MKNSMAYSFLLILLTGACSVAYSSNDNELDSKRKDLMTNLKSRSNSEGMKIKKTPGGYIRFLSASAGISTSSTTKLKPKDAPYQFIGQYGELLHNKSNDIKFKTKRIRSKRYKGNYSKSFVKCQQTYAGLDVFGAEIVFQLNDNGDIEAVNSDIMRESYDLDDGVVSIKPVFNKIEAQDSAIYWMLDKYTTSDVKVSESTLVIYAPSVVGRDGLNVLAWKIIIGNEEEAINECVLVDAENGEVVFHYPLIYSAKVRAIYDSNNTTANPGTLTRSEGDAASAIIDVNEAYDFFGDTYDFYDSYHDRDGIDDDGMTMSATTRYCYPGYTCSWANAMWSGTWDRMYFGDGFTAADDVVGHELTHGVTDNESDLIYANESGAINESFSDMWGEWIDQVNGVGTDTAAVKWLLGEDVPIYGAIRDMENPPTYSDPDCKSSQYWYSGADVSTYVHTNSGVGNKLCYLLTDGDTFNGHTVTSMGITTTADLMYECQTNLLTSAADYEDLGYALLQAAVNLGLTQSQQDNIRYACYAVEI